MWIVQAGIAYVSVSKMLDVRAMKDTGITNDSAHVMWGLLEGYWMSTTEFL